MADYASLLPGSKRTSGRIVEYNAPDILEAAQAFRAMVGMVKV